jgi:hypothetical protein
MTALDTSLQETAHIWPHFLPDGRHFLYLAWSRTPEKRAIYVGKLDSDRKTRIMTSDSMAVYVPPGFLLFHRQGTLFAQAFDTAALVLHGEPVRIAEGVVHDPSTGNTAFAVSSTGTLVYRGDASAQIQQLAWFDRQGQRLENVGPAGRFSGVALSPDEKMVAVDGREPGMPAVGIGILEISTDITSPLTGNPAADSGAVWSPDSQTFSVFLQPGGASRRVSAGYRKPRGCASPRVTGRPSVAGRLVG